MKVTVSKSMRNAISSGLMVRKGHCKGMNAIPENMMENSGS